MLTELKYIQSVPELVPIPAKPHPVVVSSAGTVNKTDNPSAMSHASRRRHDSDNDHPAE